PLPDPLPILGRASCPVPPAPPCPAPPRRAASRVSALGARLTDPHPPHARPLLDGVPTELAGMLGRELVVQRLGVVVVHQHVASARSQLEPLLEDDPVALRRDQVADVEVVILG